MGKCEGVLKPARRDFHWMSSVEGDPEILQSLHKAMMTFYSDESERSDYQEMLSNIDEDPEEDSSTARMARYIAGEDPASVLEVGCGDGRLYRTLRREGWNADYTGTEVAEHVVANNQERHPEVRWEAADAYELPVETDTVELVCSEFVLEHLVYPVRALNEMIRVVKPGGQLLLIFPDFVSSGRLASQVLGFTPASTALERLGQGRPIDSLVSLYDSRIRLPRALKRARKEVGPFPVNLRPQCLTYSEITLPDVDAVYIASKDEVEGWALSKNYSVKFPWGKSGRFYETAHMSIHNLRR